MGEHIRKRRMDLGLLQRDAANAMGVSTDSLCNWETGGNEPEVRYWPGIILFLGYEPTDPGNCLAR